MITNWMKWAVKSRQRPFVQSLSKFTSRPWDGLSLSQMAFVSAIYRRNHKLLSKQKYLLSRGVIKSSHFSFFTFSTSVLKQGCSFFPLPRGQPLFFFGQLEKSKNTTAWSLIIFSVKTIIMFHISYSKGYSRWYSFFFLLAFKFAY